MSGIAFKINKVLLEYILNNRQKHNLFIDPNSKHEYEDL